MEEAEQQTKNPMIARSYREREFARLMGEDDSNVGFRAPPTDSVQVTQRDDDDEEGETILRSGF